MKGSGLPLCLLAAVFYLCWTSSAGLKTLHLGRCVITANLQEIQNGFSEIHDSVQAKDENIDIRILRKTHSLQDTKPADRCCLLRHLLRLYLDRVFKNYQTPDHHTLRKISSLANSFLTIKKELRLCHAHMTCHCGEEATEKYSQILSYFEELEPQAAAVKALSELDILLRWMEETD
ncbi:interleukin-20 [Choloepus didactylus]|uniref:interleukin-20 n=1 Tax=Choloepus didactylus TaxID=27675 RepID=UPI00189F736C|nr:interleukin-20 [Choloepus didactylus]